MREHQVPAVEDGNHTQLRGGVGDPGLCKQIAFHGFHHPIIQPRIEDEELLAQRPDPEHQAGLERASQDLGIRRPQRETCIERFPMMLDQRLPAAVMTVVPLRVV